MCSSWPGSYTAPTSSFYGSAVAVDTSGNPGTYFYYYDNDGGSANEYTTGVSTYLPEAFGVPNLNGSGGFFNAEGAFSNPSTYPAGGGGLPWALNSSATIATLGSGYNTSCTRESIATLARPQRPAMAPMTVMASPRQRDRLMDSVALPTVAL